jgi:pimeloyl-ACP methyl ester carboxylesterase
MSVTRGTSVVVLTLAAALAATAGSATGPRPLREKCGETYGVAAKPFWLETADRVPLYAIETGNGATGVVLVHESPADLCGWLPYIHSLRGAGLRILAIDLRLFGDSRPPDGVSYLAYDRDLRAAIAHLRRRGAKHVVLVGASFGGATVLTYGSRVDADAVVSMSGELSLPSRHLDSLAGVRGLRVPLLIVGSRHDGYLPVDEALKLLHAAGSRDKRTAFYPGGFHGWDIVEDAPYAPRARALVLGWIRARFR